jgi:hypothetical protein
MRRLALLLALALPACGGPDPQMSDLAGVADMASTGSDGASSDAASGDANMAMLLCGKYGPPNLLPFAGPVYRVQNQPSASGAPSPAGGTIVNGIYVTKSNTSWGGGSGTSGGDLRSILVLESGAWFYRIEFDSVDDMNFSGGFYTVDPGAKTIDFGSAKCGGGGLPGGDPLSYTADPMTFKTYLDRMVGPTPTHIIKEIVYEKM